MEAIFDYETSVALRKMLHSKDVEDRVLATEILKNFNLPKIYYSILGKNLFGSKGFELYNSAFNYYSSLEANHLTFIEIKQCIYHEYKDDKLLITIYNEELKTFYGVDHIKYLKTYTLESLEI